MGRWTSPWMRAALVAAAYVVGSALYIYLSSGWAAEVALDPTAHARLETIKGFAFVGTTGVALAILLAFQFDRMDRARDALVRGTHALARAERRSTTAAVTASVAHDMKNELTIAIASHQVLRGRSMSPEDRAASDDLDAALRDLQELSTHLMKRARDADATALAEVDVGSLAARIAKMARFVAPKARATIELDLRSGCTVRAHERDLEHVVLNLVLNAMEASIGGRVGLRVRSEGETVVLEVSDDGPGVPVALRERIFEPFFTTKGEAGNGIGLATVRQVVRRLGGRIAVEDAEPAGARFRVTLPR